MNDTDNFHIDPHTGWVSTSRSFDFEKVQRFNLTVLAQDKGEKPKHSSITFIVVVTGVNEYPPVFEKTRFSFNVPANASIGQVVGKVSGLCQFTIDYRNVSNKCIPRISAHSQISAHPRHRIIE